MYAMVLGDDNEHRKAVIEQLVNTALPESKHPEMVSCCVKAFMAAGLQAELIKLLEMIVLQVCCASHVLPMLPVFASVCDVLRCQVAQDDRATGLLRLPCVVECHLCLCALQNCARTCTRTTRSGVRSCLCRTAPSRATPTCRTF